MLKGYKHSTETKLKMRKAKLGVKRSEEAKKKLRVPHKGSGIYKHKLLSEKHKRKIGLSVKKTMDNPEVRKKLSKAKSKKNHPNWKGGITPIILLIRNSLKYRQWRSDIFTRDNWTCQNPDCKNRRGCYLEAHHIKLFSKIMEEYNIRTSEEALNCEELWNINNGITLCRKCHDKTKKYLKVEK